MDREKAIGLFRLHLSDPFTPFTRYGMDVQIPQAKEAIINLALQLHEHLLPEELEKERVATCIEIINLLGEEAAKSKLKAIEEEQESETQPD